VKTVVGLTVLAGMTLNPMMEIPAVVAVNV